MEPVVWLITGSSSVGKTTLGRTLANRVAAPHLCVDDITRDDPPGPTNPFAERPRCWDEPVGRLVDRLILKGAALESTLAEVVDTHLALNRRVVLEGEGIHPALVARYVSAPVGVAYVVEDDPHQIERALALRSAEFRALAPRRRAAIVQMNIRYGAWLAGEAVREGQPVIASRPWRTLVDRYLTAVDSHPTPTVGT